MVEGGIWSNTADEAWEAHERIDDHFESSGRREGEAIRPRPDDHGGHTGSDYRGRVLARLSGASFTSVAVVG